MRENVFLTESGMTFGPFDADCFYHIEKAEEWKKLYDNGCKISECVVYRRNKNAWLSIEAKTTLANPHSPLDGGESFRNEIEEISEKLENSLDIFLKARLCNYTPEGFEQIDFRNAEIVFVLVIRNHQYDWLINVTEALNQEIQRQIRFNRLWNVRVLAINEETAARYGLVTRSEQQGLQPGSGF